MALFKAEGLVLRTRDLGEADKIIVLYTRERGKISGVARGSRRAKSRLLAVSQLFSHSRFLMYEGRSRLYPVTQGELISSFRPLREDIARVAYASYIAELLDALLDEAEPNEVLFRTVLEGFTLVSGADDLDLSIRWFELKLMDQLGYRPELNGCVECGSDLDSRSVFSSRQGGMLCHLHAGSGPDAIALTPGVVNQLRRLLETSPARLGILRPSPGDRVVLERVLREHIDQRLDRPLRSRDFLQAMKALESG